MLSKRQKVIIVFIILLLLLSAIFLIFSFDKVKYFFLKTVNRKNTEKILSERKKCEENFVFDEGKISWADKHGQSSSLRKYALCEFGVKADYEYCALRVLSIDSGDNRACQKIVVLKKVFLPLVQKEKSPQDVVDDLKYYLSIDPGSKWSSLFSERETNLGELLNGFVGKDGNICEGLDKKKSCLGFVTGDVKYCQDILFDEDKNDCINEAKMRQALESQNMEICSEIKSEDGMMPVLCESIINKDDQFCAKNREYLGDFIGEYCKIENPLPI